MRRLGALCLFLGLSAPAFAADAPKATEPASVPWYRWLFLGDRAKPVAAKPVDPLAKETPAIKGNAPPTREAVARMMAEEQKVYLDRLNAISKIRLVANQQGDEELLKKADDLEAQAEELYKLRSAKVPKATEARDDRATLEKGRDDRPNTAMRPSMRKSTRGGDR